MACPRKPMAALAKLQTLTSDQANWMSFAPKSKPPLNPRRSRRRQTRDRRTHGRDIPTLEVEMEDAPVDDTPPRGSAGSPSMESPQSPKEMPVVRRKLQSKASLEPAVHEPKPVLNLSPTVLKEFVSELETSWAMASCPIQGQAGAGRPRLLP